MKSCVQSDYPHLKLSGNDMSVNMKEVWLALKIVEEEQ